MMNLPLDEIGELDEPEAGDAMSTMKQITRNRAQTQIQASRT